MRRARRAVRWGRCLQARPTPLAGSRGPGAHVVWLSTKRLQHALSLRWVGTPGPRTPHSSARLMVVEACPIHLATCGFWGWFNSLVVVLCFKLLKWCLGVVMPTTRCGGISYGSWGFARLAYCGAMSLIDSFLNAMVHIERASTAPVLPRRRPAAPPPPRARGARRATAHGGNQLDTGT